MGKRSYGITSPGGEAQQSRPRPLTGPLDERRARALPVLMGLAGLVSVGMLAAPVPGVELGARLIVGALSAPVLVGVPVGLIAVPLHRYGHSRSVLRDHLQHRLFWLTAAIGVGALLIAVIPMAVLVGITGVAVLLAGAVGVSLLATGMVLFLLAKGLL